MYIFFIYVHFDIQYISNPFIIFQLEQGKHPKHDEQSAITVTINTDFEPDEWICIQLKQLSYFYFLCLTESRQRVTEITSFGS